MSWAVGNAACEGFKISEVVMEVQGDADSMLVGMREPQLLEGPKQAS